MNYKNQINDYLNGELDENDKRDFIKHLNSNLDFKNLVEDIKFNDNLLKKTPCIETDSDFIISLNSRIDSYDSKSPIAFFQRLFNISKDRANFNQIAGVMSLALIILFTTFKISNHSSANNATLDNINNQLETSIAVNDVDSLENVNSGSAILLLGNDK
jgi:hypothetical protein